MICYKSSGLALAHAAACLAGDLESYAADVADGNEGAVAPIFNAQFCMEVFHNDLSNAVADGALNEASAALDWMELRAAVARYFGPDAVAFIAADIWDFK